MKRKTVLLAALLLVLCLVMSACSKGADSYTDKYAAAPVPAVDETEPPAVEVVAETEKPHFIVSYDDFRYDNKVSWNSSYTDIVGIYGQPDVVRDAASIGVYEIQYDHIRFCGHEGFSLTFRFARDRQILTEIGLEIVAKDSSEYKWIKEDLIKTFAADYGTSSASVEGSTVFQYDWSTQLEDARVSVISLSDNKINVRYHSSRDPEFRPAHNDLPES